MDVSPSKDLFRPKAKRRVVEPQDDANSSSDDDSDVDFQIEESYHRPLEYFYPRFSVRLLQRSMGIPLEEPLVEPKDQQNPNNRTQFVVNFNRQDSVVQAGSLRNYIILGSRPTYPYTIVSLLRQITNNPFDPWPYRLPESPFSAVPGSIVHWDIDAEAQLLRPREPPLIQGTDSFTPLFFATPISRNPNLDLMRVECAWDIERDKLVQALVWSDPDSNDGENRIFEVRYGDEIGCLPVNKGLVPFICFCGCGMMRKEDAHVRIALRSGVLFWFPYEIKSIPESTRNFKAYNYEAAGARPWFWFDAAAQAKDELKSYFKIKGHTLSVIDISLIERPEALRLKSARDHASWYGSLDILSLVVERNNEICFLVQHRVNFLSMTCKCTRMKRLEVQDRRRLLMRNTHDCAKLSWHLPVKHYPTWGSTDQSLGSIDLEEHGVELKLDFLSSGVDNIMLNS
ncbi:hypothetical protein TWF694_009771 [Orbilia ellipsospora]|uniref:Uncharacterized protein n=1 Tax=Orbilia ellipsospora TaxID=2528407 RepID=A0AAV9XBT7_9PEZI